MDDFDAMRAYRSRCLRECRPFEVVDTLCALRSSVMRQTGASFDAVSEAIRNALPGDGSTPANFKRLSADIGERAAWEQVLAAAWVAVAGGAEGGEG